MTPGGFPSLDFTRLVAQALRSSGAASLNPHMMHLTCAFRQPPTADIAKVRRSGADFKA
jgi:hypothetical protein